MAQQQTQDEGTTAYADVSAKFVDVPGHYNFKKQI